MLKAWIFLLLAIFCEVFGVSVMNYVGTQDSNNIRFFAFLFMFFCIGVAYYFMALSIRKINVGTAYAIWEVVGLVLVTLVSLIIFGAALSLQEMIGIVCGVIGITLVNLGEVHNESENREKV